MAPIIPSTTLTITVGNVGTTLGNATKNMGGFRGFGGSVPSSGAISMSQCQKIQYGVGFYNVWLRTNAASYHGNWNNTSITNNGSFTVVVWLCVNASNGNWRNLFHATSTGGDCCGGGLRAPASWLYAGDTGFHVRHDTSGAANDGIAETALRIAFNSTVYMVTAVYNGTNLKAYLNGSLSDNFTLAGTPVNQSSTGYVFSPDTYYALNNDFFLKNLWFFPYPMTGTQVSNYYNSLSGSIGSPSFPSVTTNLPSNQVSYWDNRLSTAYLYYITYSSSTYSWNLVHSGRTVYIVGFTGLPSISLSKLVIVWAGLSGNYTVVNATNTNLANYNGVTIGLGAVDEIRNVTFYCYVNETTNSVSGESLGMLYSYSNILIYGS